MNYLVLPYAYNVSHPEPGLSILTADDGVELGTIIKTPKGGYWPIVQRDKATKHTLKRQKTWRAALYAILRYHAVPAQGTRA